jgi:hypothetical protein
MAPFGSAQGFARFQVTRTSPAPVANSAGRSSPGL